MSGSATKRNQKKSSSAKRTMDGNHSLNGLTDSILRLAVLFAIGLIESRMEAWEIREVWEVES